MNLSLFPDGACGVVVGAATGGGDATSSEWYTPRWLLAWLPAVVLDPCWAPGSSVQALHQVDCRDGRDGLALSWADLVEPGADGVVFCNPPYNACATWVDKCAAEARYLQHTLVALVPAYAGDRYWHRSVWRQAAFVGFIAGRIRFETGNGTPAKDAASFCSAVVVWDRDRARAERVVQLVAERAGSKVVWVDAGGLGLEGVDDGVAEQETEAERGRQAMPGAADVPATAPPGEAGAIT
jgi:hypothetical protein